MLTTSTAIRAHIGLLALVAACGRSPVAEPAVPLERTSSPEHVDARTPLVLTPPPADDLDHTRGLMWKLAQQVRLLGFITDEPDKAATDARAQLQAMEDIALAIAASPERRSHPILDDNIGGLVADIRRAEAEVAGESPEWGTTHSITTACVRCHELRTCPFDSYRKCVDVPVY